MSDTNKKSKRPGPVAASSQEFGAKLEPLLKQIAHQGREVIIIHNGYPIARVAPYQARPGDPAFPVEEKPVSVPYGKNRSQDELLDDLVGPMPTEWWLGQEAKWEDAPR